MKRYILVCLAILSLMSCNNAPKETKRQITVTIEPLRYFTEQIAGDKFHVTTMVPKGGNPETYEPTPQQMVKLSESNLYIKVGNIGFEQTWMKKLAQNAPHIIVVDSSEGIEPAHSAHSVNDPHTWMSTVNAAQIAHNIYKALVEIDQKDSALYKRNYEALLTIIEETDIKVREQITKDKSAAFLIYHPALTYFARDYQLLQIPVEEEGREPSAAQLKKTIQLSKAMQAKVMFVQKEFETRNTQIVCKEAGTEPIEINPLNYDWSKEMVSIATKLK